jgi:tRNA(fMet)-specific endonuclease VapC
MAVQYLLDTNIVSYLLKRRMPQVRQRFEQVTVQAAAISAITEAEILYGLTRVSGPMQLRTAADSFFASVTCLPWDSAAARSYASLRTMQERKGRPLATEDMMIAAHALTSGLILVTHDLAFAYVDGLRTEDWTVA